MIQAGILQPIDYVGMVQRGFQQGQQQRKEMEMDKALQALAANPQDPQAIANITRYNPTLGMKLQSDQAQQEAEKAKQLTEVFGRAARAAKTPQQWDAIATWLSQNGVPGAANVVGKFSPEMRLGYMAQAGLDEDKDPAATSLQRNYEFFKEVDPSGKLADSYIRGQANPVQWVRTEDESGIHLTPVSNSGPQVATATPQGSPITKESYDALPPGAEYTAPDGSKRIKGGQTGSAPSGGFSAGPR